jgi:methionyl-tRNA formyltransferase
MRIVFFGSPASAVPSLKRIVEEGHSVELVITQPDRPSGRGKGLTPPDVKKKALEMNLPVYQPGRIKKDAEALDRLRIIQPDLNVVVAYGQIMPASIIYLPRFNSINVHFSLLPKYRGASPVQWTLLNGEKSTGITIFELNEKMDEGDILAQQRMDIFPDDNSAKLESRLSQTGAELLVRTIARITEIPRQKQDHSLATYAPKIQKEDGRIDWEKDAFHLECKIRALTPWPSVFTFLNHKRVKILSGQQINRHEPQSPPGQILDVHKGGIEVACGRGSVFRVESLQPENKKAMSAYAFSLGARIKPGQKFG